MNYPKKIKTKDHEYVFVKEYTNHALYKEIKQGWHECFTPFDLGLRKGVNE